MPLPCGCRADQMCGCEAKREASDDLLASAMRKLLAPDSEAYVDFRDYGVVIDGTLRGLTEQEERAIREVLGDG